MNSVGFVWLGCLLTLFSLPVHGNGSRDLSAPPARGVLRVVRPVPQITGLDRGVDAGVREAALLGNFAKDHGLEIQWIRSSSDRLAADLLAGRGDLAVGCRLEWVDAGADLLFSRPVFNPLRPEPGATDEFDSGQDDSGIFWMVPAGSAQLLKRLNDFLVREHPGIKPRPHFGDLAKMKERGHIRLLTRNNPACYFIHRGELMGFEYELVRRFARKHGLEVDVIVPPRWVDLRQWMLEGRGDVVAASITVSEDRKKMQGLEFCRPYGGFNEIVVARESDPPLKSISDLAGRTVYLREKSNYWSTMEKLQKQSGIAFELKAVPGTMETREILHRVESGEFDLTVADSSFLDIEINSGRKLRSALMFKQRHRYGWGVRQGNPELKAAIDRFFEKMEGTADYNYLYKKYFGQDHAVREFQNADVRLETAILSPYDSLIRISSAKHGFHWCLIAAQMFQESRFDPEAKSWSGALGLMQLMPATARELGLDGQTILDPARNIDAGVDYLGKQRKRVPAEVDAFNRLCFALAAYNGGYGHLIDARTLARQLGRDPNLWVENVDHAYSLLSTPEYADKAKYGYCRSEEIIGYVRKIIARYVAYKSEIERLAQTGQ